MAFPTNVFSLAHAVGTNFFNIAFGGSVAMSTGLNQIINDVIALGEKLGTGASTATANTVLRGTGSGTTAYGKIVSADITDATIVAADISASAAIAPTQIIQGGTQMVMFSTGAANAWSSSPTLAGTVTGNVVNSATSMQAGTTFRAGTKIYPGALNGVSPGAQAFGNLQMPYQHNALAANTSATVASFPLGIFWVFNIGTGALGEFRWNAVALTDRSSDATIQIGGSDPGASSSKIWLSISGGTMTIYNRYATAQFIQIIGIGGS